MGWKIDNSFPDKDRVYRSPKNNIELDTTFKFDVSWDWLMPVVEKIEDLEGIYFVELIGRHCCISTMINHNWPEDKSIISEYDSFNTKSKLEATYKAVVDFIIAYNGWGIEERSLKDL